MPRRRAISHGQAERSACICLNLILACVVSSSTGRRGKSPGSSVSATRSQMESISPCWNTSTPLERDNVPLGQFILDQTLARRRAKRVALSV
jgi:hypothetical protein